MGPGWRSQTFHAEVRDQSMPRSTALRMAARDAVSSWRPPPNDQPPPPIAQAPKPTRVISRSLDPSRCRERDWDTVLIAVLLAVWTESVGAPHRTLTGMAGSDPTPASRWRCRGTGRQRARGRAAAPGPSIGDRGSPSSSARSFSSRLLSAWIGA
jgi:hypothetical protein